MTNFFKTRVNRISASAMLLIWVFALISGVANVCLLEAPGINAQAGAIQQINQHGAAKVSLNSHAAIEVDLDRAEDEHISKQPCLKVCDDSSRSLPNKYSAGQIDGGSPINIAVLWSLAEPIRLQYKQPSRTQHAASLLPLRVLYSRLAL